MSQSGNDLMILFKFLVFFILIKYCRSQECSEHNEQQLLPESLEINVASTEEMLPRSFVLLFEDLSKAHTMLGNNYPFVLIDADEFKEIRPKSCLIDSFSTHCVTDKERMSSHANLEAYQTLHEGIDLEISKDLNSQLIAKRKKDKKFEITVRAALENIFSSKLSSQDFSRLQPYVNAVFGKFIARLPSAITNQPLACAEIASISYMRLLVFQRDNAIQFPIHYIEVDYNGEKRKYNHVFLIVNAELLPKEPKNIQNFDAFDMTKAFIIDPYFGDKFAIESFYSNEALNIHKGLYASRINVKLLPSYNELQTYQSLTKNSHALTFFQENIEQGLKIGESTYNPASISKKMS